MPDVTTTEHSLQDAARKARKREQLQQRLSATKALADYREEAPQSCRKVAEEILGNYAVETTWEATGGPDDYFSYSAIAEIDGLRFLAVLDHKYDYARQRLYLLRPCGNMDHPPADRRIQVVSLAQLADVLDHDHALDGDCSACALMENPEQPVTPMPTAQERLVEALETVVEERIGQRLDGFLSTYLPDRI